MQPRMKLQIASVVFLAQVDRLSTQLLLNKFDVIVWSSYQI